MLSHLVVLQKGSSLLSRAKQVSWLSGTVPRDHSRQSCDKKHLSSSLFFPVNIAIAKVRLRSWKSCYHISPPNVCAKLEPHFPLLDTWFTHFQWSRKLQERGCRRRIHTFKNAWAPCHLMLSFPNDPALVFVFLWHYHSQRVNFQIAYSRVHAAVTQSRRCGSLSAKPARWRHQHPFGSLDRPWTHSVGAGWHIGMEGETPPFYQARAERG